MNKIIFTWSLCILGLVIYLIAVKKHSGANSNCNSEHPFFQQQQHKWHTCIWSILNLFSNLKLLLLISANFMTRRLMIIETFNIRSSCIIFWLKLLRAELCLTPASKAFSFRHTLTDTSESESAQGWLVKRLQGCQGWPSSSSDWQAERTRDWGWECECVCVEVRGGGVEACYTCLLQLPDLTDCWITESKPGEKGESSSCFHCQQQLILQVVECRSGGKTLSWEKTDWGRTREREPAHK